MQENGGTTAWPSSKFWVLSLDQWECFRRPLGHQCAILRPQDFCPSWNSVLLLVSELVICISLVLSLQIYTAFPSFPNPCLHTTDFNKDVQNSENTKETRSANENRCFWFEFALTILHVVHQASNLQLSFLYSWWMPHELKISFVIHFTQCLC